MAKSKTASKATATATATATKTGAGVVPPLTGEVVTVPYREFGTTLHGWDGWKLGEDKEGQPVILSGLVPPASTSEKARYRALGSYKNGGWDFDLDTGRASRPIEDAIRMAASIQRDGQRTPCVAYHRKDGTLRLLEGMTRATAVSLLGQGVSEDTQVFYGKGSNGTGLPFHCPSNPDYPLTVAICEPPESADKEAYDLQLTNGVRVAPKPIDFFRSVVALLESGRTQQEVASQLNVRQATVSEMDTIRKVCGAEFVKLCRQDVPLNKLHGFARVLRCDSDDKKIGCTVSKQTKATAFRDKMLADSKTDAVTFLHGLPTAAIKAISEDFQPTGKEIHWALKTPLKQVNPKNAVNTGLTGDPRFKDAFGDSWKEPKEYDSVTKWLDAMYPDTVAAEEAEA